MPERPTQDFETSGGCKLVLREYITGAENREIRSIYMRALKGDAKDGDVSKVEFEADNKAIELVVVSLDGASSDIVNRVLALPLPDFKQVIEQITERVEGKKKSETVS
jgi:hypothetical protein